MLKAVTSLAGLFGACCGLAIATPASATYYVYPAVRNLDSVGTITITDVSWSGSFYPRFPDTVAPGVTTSGAQFKTVSTSGISEISFKATIAYNGHTQTCLFYYTIDNSTGSVSTYASRLTTDPVLPTCSVTGSGSSPIFQMASNIPVS